MAILVGGKEQLGAVQMEVSQKVLSTFVGDTLNPKPQILKTIIVINSYSARETLCLKP